MNIYSLKRMILAILILFGLAVLAEFFELKLIYGLAFSFTSLFVLLIYMAFGPWIGVGAAIALFAVAIVGMGEPFIDLTGVVEIVFLSIMRVRQRNQLLLYDGIYWLILGLPLMIMTYMVHDHMLTMESTLMMTTVVTNCLFNALLADVACKYAPLSDWFGTGQGKERSLKLGQLLFHFSITAVAVPYLIFIISSAWNLDRTMVESTLRQAMNTANSIKEEVGKWKGEDINGIRMENGRQIDKLNEIVSNNTTKSLFHIMFTDSQDRILAGNDPRNKLGETYDWRAGSKAVKLGETFYEKIPQTRSMMMPIENWRDAEYIYSDMITHIPLQIYISMPLESNRLQIYQHLLHQLRLLLLFLVCSALIGLVINRAIVRSLSQLAETTTGLADELNLREDIVWPSSNIVEIKSLIDNFRHASINLVRMFRESLEMNDKLIEQTTMLRNSEEKLQHLAYYDVLTGLPNRRLFSRHLQALLETGGSRLPVAVIFADLNRFKQINDTLGHAVGDELLQMIAAMYSKLTTTSSRVYRFGGDEFVFVLEGADEQALQRQAERIFQLFAEPIELLDSKLYVTVSLGVSLYPRDGQDLDTIMKNADMAMYVAKEQGGNAVHFFDAAMNEAVMEKMMIDNGIREALVHRQFKLYYQPKIDKSSQQICGMEALIRWQHPDAGMIPPTKFIPLAEDSGMILDIDEWVLREACSYNKRLQEQGLLRVPVAVNISGRHFYQGHLYDVIRAALRDSELDGKYLIVEITEGVLIKNVDQVLETITQIKALGVEISIDDFGTGYSSLNQLQRLPIYQVKLDRSFISGVTVDSKKSAIVKAVIDLAHSMNLKVVAEGIETIYEKNYLIQLGCDELQGYYYSKPLPGEQFAEMLRHDRQEAAE